jgi:HD-GYP domain-containing protein (c-di-GMP phosphodiesterase class II)
MLTINDPPLMEHLRRVANLAAAIGAELDRPASEIDVLERAALVHDLPKLAFPEAIARKAGVLLPQEREVIRISPTFGHEVLVRIDYLAEAAEVVHARYEWWDGSGYPRGLRGEAIPIPSRILAVADTFDTLLLPRRYRAAMSAAQASAEIVWCQRTQFDPQVVEAFLRARPGRDIPVTAA